MKRLAAAILCLIGSAASAQTTRPSLSVSLGFGGVFKPDTWVPVYVRVSDVLPRSARIDILSARGRLGHEVTSRVYTSDDPTVYTLYAPIGSLDRVELELREADGKLIRHLDLTDQAQQTPAALGGPAVGVVGASPGVAQRVINTLVRDSQEYVAAGSLSPRLLPERPIGYACLDVLILPELDTDAIDDGAETAIVRWVESGGILITWPGALKPTNDSPLGKVLPQLPDEHGPAAKRHLGLGDITLCGSDPTLNPASSAKDRLAFWRELTSNQVSMTADDRRVGTFDPLVVRAVAEQQIQVPPPPRLWGPILGGLIALGLIAGPGEMVMLLVYRRRATTWYTLGGLVLVVGAGVAWIAIDTGGKPTALAPTASVEVEVDDAGVETVGLSMRVEDEAPVIWLAGQRADPENQPAAELRMGQRRDGFDPAPLLALGGDAAKVRTITYGGAKAAIGFDARGEGHMTNESDQPWSAAAIASADGVQLAPQSTPASQSSNFASARHIAADDPNTRRVETGIERLAATPGWEAIFLDRRLAERLVRLQETEQATILAARIDDGNNTTYLLHVIRGR